MAHYTHSGVYNNLVLPDAFAHTCILTHTFSLGLTHKHTPTHTRTHMKTQSITPMMWWKVSGKRLQTFKPHLLFTLPPFGARLRKRMLIYFAWQVWIFCETHLGRAPGKKQLPGFYVNIFVLERGSFDPALKKGSVVCWHLWQGGVLC